MDWVIENWVLVTMFFEEGLYFNALLNPVGLILTGVLFLLGLFAIQMRKVTWLTIFAMWTIAPLHHITVEGRTPGTADVGGFGAMGALGIGILLVLAVAMYVLLIRE